MSCFLVFHVLLIPLGVLHLCHSDTVMVNIFIIKIYFQERHIWVSWLNVVTSVGNFSKNNNVTVGFFNVTLYESDWLIHSMNLIINQSLLSMAKFYLINYEMDSNILASITNSTFGQLKVDNRYEITIRSCILEGNAWRKFALMEITNSTVNIMNCYFHGFKTISGPAILNATSLTVHLETSRFFDNILQSWRDANFPRNYWLAQVYI